jgi:hypothetical protein
MQRFISIVCTAYDTRELPSEAAARNRRDISGKLHNKGTSHRHMNASSGSQRVVFNMNVIKWHFLGDYVEYIRKHGTTDNYSTQTVCFSCSSIIFNSYYI